MVRMNTIRVPWVPKAGKAEANRLSNAQRSAYFARREAAKVLRTMLQGDARRQATGSIKSLVYSPSIRNKKATFALVCETLKHLSVIKDVLEEADILSARWKKQKDLIYIIAYDLLFGQNDSLVGDAEKYLTVKKDALQSALLRIVRKNGVSNVNDLVNLDTNPELQKPRHVRVNTLKIDTSFAINELRRQYEVQKDETVPDLLVLPPGACLYNHPLVTSGGIFLQGKASSMAAVTLGPKPGWEVIDACAAPGNKTVHLAALMRGKGKIIACELNKERVKCLEQNVKLAGAPNVKIKHVDFLKLNPKDPSYSKVRAILLDPSCSGSGTALQRLDHLLPSHTAVGDAEKYLTVKKDALQSALLRIVRKNGVSNVNDLVNLDTNPELQKPRHVRVNTLKIDTSFAINELRRQYEVQKDETVPDLLVLPPGACLYNHPLVTSGGIFLQGKASSMAAVTLGPKPGWEVIDACAAPGNKTVHLAALMRGKGKIIACELNKERVKCLEQNVKLAGAPNVKIKHVDFLKLNPKDPSYSKVRAILLDPSCSGSGTALQRLDHLLPSHTAGHRDHVEINRLQKLAGFQKKVLEHALSFPAVERIVYSTCSIHQIENEDVVKSVLHLASSNGFQLATALPQWPRRGLPVFHGSEHLLQTDLTLDKEGFFIALFVRESSSHLEDYGRLVKERTGLSWRKRRACGCRTPLNIFVAKMLKVHSRFYCRNAKPQAL